MRRDQNDQKWKAVKEEVRTRDGGKDRIFRVVTPHEGMFLLRKSKEFPGLFRQLDAAHIFDVSLYPDLIYNKNNIILLNRYSHSLIDTNHDPVTGRDMSQEEKKIWWERLAGPVQWKKLMNMLDRDVEEVSRSVDS